MTGDILDPLLYYIDPYTGQVVQRVTEAPTLQPTEIPETQSDDNTNNDINDMLNLLKGRTAAPTAAPDNGGMRIFGMPILSFCCVFLLVVAACVAGWYAWKNYKGKNAGNSGASSTTGNGAAQNFDFSGMNMPSPPPSADFGGPPDIPPPPPRF